MADIKVGDRVRINDRPDWPMPTGYKLANSEGRVAEVIKEPKGYIMVLLDKDTAGIDTSIPLSFRVEALEKI
ncbi:hypothetical protein ACFLX3_03730 [Chloroflexota bacterium]